MDTTLFNLPALKSAQEKPLAEVKEDIRKTLQNHAAEERFFDLQEEIEDRIAGGDSLVKTGEDLDLSVQTVKKFSRSNTASLAASLQAAILQTPNGDVSDPISLTDTQIAYIGVNNLVPSTPKPLDTVRAEVTEDVYTQLLLSKLRELATQISKTQTGSLAGIC